MQLSHSSSNGRFHWQHLALALVAFFAGCFATASTTLADCGPGSPPDCTCVYVEVPLEFYPNHVRPVLTPLYPQFTVLTALTPVESYAGTLELNLPGLFPTPETFLVAPPITQPVTQPIVTFINPTPFEPFVVNNLSPIVLPTFTTLNLSPTILPTTSWSSSGVLEHHGSILTVVLPDLSYLLNGNDGNPAVPEPAPILMAVLAAPFLALGRKK